MKLFEQRNRHKMLHRWGALFMCLLTVLSLINLPALTEAEGLSIQPLAENDSRDILFYGTLDIENAITADTMHFIIRHWHVEKDPADKRLRDSHTVLVEGYIVPSGSTYTCYARAYSVDNEDGKSGTYTGFTRIDENTDSVYIGIGDNNKIELPMNPYHEGSAYYERFAGFSVSAGQTAVTVDNGDVNNYNVGAKLTIDPSMAGQIHLVKCHFFYTSELATVDGETMIIGEDGKREDFPDYIDTVNAATKKYYNSNEGLHTDKTASTADRYTVTVKTEENGQIVEKEVYDGRTFDLDLESWFIDGDPINIGMVLDASGSMAFTAGTPTPIKVNDQTLIRNKGLANVTPNSTWSNVFLTENELKNILNPNNTDSSRLGSSGYTYFIYDARKGTEEFVPLGYWNGGYANGYPSNDGKNALGTLSTGAGAGWYYINPTSKWGSNYANKDVQSGKTLNGIPNNKSITFKDYIYSIPGGLEGKYPFGGNERRTYSPDTTTSMSATKFYIDESGYLRCFYYVNANSYLMDDGTYTYGYGTSYIYENSDEDYIKVEALQRALGAFVTELEAKSPESLVSAVRFSTAESDLEIDKLVLLDWTANVRDAQQMLSLQYGKKDPGDDNLGGTITGDKSSYLSDKYSDFAPLEQYNYGLTGNTSTVKGLIAFKNHLQQRLQNYLNKAYPGNNSERNKKYIIIFTDGKDTDLKEDPKATDAYTEALALKRAGYTIYCVMLSGGPVQEGTDDYKKAMDFLTALSGPGTGSGNTEDQRYVFSTEDADVKAMGGNASDALTYIFTEEILPKMLNSLEKYDMQDYIDPRFDLVDENDTVWHLNADGNVVKVKSDGSTETIKLSDTVGAEIKFARADSSASVVLSATLYYDSEENMYYMKWVDQTVPGSPIGASKLPVWHAKITVRAKDDFIGGNSILSNGNSEKENYVYASEKEQSASSGIDQSMGKKNDRPAKGFPRTTVDIGPGPIEVDRVQLIYMGEDLSARTVAKDLMAAAKEASEGTSAYFYWEYLERYAAYYNEHKDTVILPEGITYEGEDLTIDDLIDALFYSENGDKIQIPYYYLPNLDQTNQTGTEKHEADCIGYLTYSMTTENVTPKYPNGESVDTETRTCDVTVKYTPYTEAQRESSHANDTLVTEKKTGSDTDPAYSWDMDYKPEAGDEMKDKLVTGTHRTDLVSGEIALQVELSERDIALLFAEGVTKITYTAELKRNYPGTKFGEDIGTFTAVIEITENGEAILKTADIEYNGTDSSGYKSYVEEYGLPIGTYTLANAAYEFEYSGDAPSVPPFTFYNPYVVGSDDEEYAKSDNFKLENVDGHDTPADYIADLSPNSGEITLGQEYDDKVYTDTRFGIFRVSGYPSGELELGKTVEEPGDKEKEFAFVVDLVLPQGVDILPLPSGMGDVGHVGGYPYTGKSIDGVLPPADGWLALREVTDTAGNTYYTGIIKLKHGQSIVLCDLPDGTKYTITEQTPDGYVDPPIKTGEIGTIEMADRQQAAFSNIPITLTITKKVDGGAGNVLFNFAVKLVLPEDKKPFPLPNGEGEDGDVGYSYTIFEGDDVVETGWLKMTAQQDEDDTYTAKVQLKHGQSIVIKEIPYGTKYSVEEVDIPDGYEQKSKTNDSGVIYVSAKAEFVNMGMGEFPTTGGVGTKIFIVIGSLVLIAAFVLIICRCKRKQET